MMRTFFLILFLMLSGLSFGQDSLATDISVRKFDEKRWKEIVGNMNYQEEPEEKEQPQKEDDKEGFSFPSFSISPQLLQAISFALVFALFAFILYYVSTNTKLSQKNRKVKPVDMTVPVENIEELDIEGLLRDSLANGDLRLAVRIHYLLLLKNLNDAGLITWKKNKTNRDYLSELYGRNACYDDVRSLTLAYEVVWYGEHSVSSELFQRLSGDFETVGRQITQVQAAP